MYFFYLICQEIPKCSIVNNKNTKKVVKVQNYKRKNNICQVHAILFFKSYMYLQPD